MCGNIQQKYDTFVVPNLGLLLKRSLVRLETGGLNGHILGAGFSGVSSEMGTKEIKLSGSVYLRLMTMGF